uniref:RAC family serine/threonineprotein kinase putative n=1 Tax=Albugo laibachii Nc14 TaxID=890382 RepID=F0WPI0_9STRA|nr:RAC family serine/threonineprotein kinase putative [Albugo laibachii Nc14]|eukprot:CCA23228.1 RAC family serine/threonineprotein kinase putative [Albugo laibachii Nc14]
MRDASSSDANKTFSSRNEDELEELVQSLIAQIQLKLKSELLLREIFIPNSRAEAKANIFVSHNYATCAKLCIVLQAGPGIKPGIWSKIINAKTGFQSSMIPYLKTAIQSGFGVVIMNPSTNTAIVHGHRTKILHSSTPQDHVHYVWRQYIMPNAAKEINFVAYDAAGALLKTLLNSLSERDSIRVAGIVFVESSHTISTTDSAHARKILDTRSVNFEASDDPTFAEISASRSLLGCISLSVGRSSGDMSNRDWTLHSVQTSVFVFFQAVTLGMNEAIDAIRATLPNKVVVTVNRARLTGQPYNNPFAVVQCVGQKKETVGNHKYTMDPEWNQSFSFPAGNADEIVTISIKDKIFPLGSTNLGFISIKINEIGLNRADRRWYALRHGKDPQSRGNGEVELTLEWVHDTFVARSDNLIRSHNRTMVNDSSISSSAGLNSDSAPIDSISFVSTDNVNNCCNLCQKSFVLHRKRYCRMCLRVVCASCSDRLFLPGFSEAKRVCLGCCDLNTMLQNKVACYRSQGMSSDSLTLGKGASLYANRHDQYADEMKNMSERLAVMRQRELAKEAEIKPMNIEDFELLKVVGRGAFGKVLLVKKKEGKSKGEIFAMKILVKSHIIKNGQIENTRAEQHILKEIDHPFIVRLRYAFQNPEKLYLIMDYYPGGSMFYHLRKSKRFTEERTRIYMAQLLLALMHLHEKQIAYRDLKLENILIDQCGNIALTDFGLSKEGQTIDGAIRASQADLAMKTICGTAEYMAPELLRHHPYGKVVDWWSYGILLFEMLTGKTPFVDRNRRQMFKNIMQAEVVYPSYVSSSARSLTLKLLNRDPSKRLGSGQRGGQDIMDHTFFEQIDWEKLLRKEYEPPFVPDVSSTDDVTNVPEMFQSMPAVDSPVKGKQGDAHHFEDFSYQERTLMLA